MLKSINAKDIELLVLDVDGVLTNGLLYYDENGGEAKTFNVHDGLGLKLLARAGIKVAIITGRQSMALSRRAKELDISMVFQGVRNKKRQLDELLQSLQLNYSQVAYMGDDVNDLSCLQEVALPMAPADACAQVLQIASFVASRAGGQGAVRQACELILQDKGLWDELVADFFLG